MKVVALIVQRITSMAHKQYKISNWEDSAEFVFVIDLPAALLKCKYYLYEADLEETEDGLIELLESACSELEIVARYHQYNEYGISKIPEEYTHLPPIRGTHGIVLTSAYVHNSSMYAEEKTQVDTWPEAIKEPPL